MVRERGLEPPRPCGHYLLKVARLPVSPLARVQKFILKTGCILLKAEKNAIKLLDLLHKPVFFLTFS